jgi:NADPH-dependent glutamate synthase beta subunit-like oxidoreductase/dihydroorotate dehydrogenase/Pyruvate/2-oxoacid:ferredoxin oxidoreductase delta subunit
MKHDEAVAAYRTASDNSILTDAQLRIEIEKCEYCAEKPCKTACPCDCSPADFIMAARLGAPSDYRRATAEIMSMNPLGGVCGQVCPERFCMAACSHGRVDAPLNIPAIQATIVARARALGVMPVFRRVRPNGKRVAIIGGGPSGLAAAAMLGQHGYAAHIYETRDEPGGMCHLIPRHRLHRPVLDADVAFVLSMSNVSRRKRPAATDPLALLTKGYDAVVLAAGLWDPIVLPIPNADHAIKGLEFLEDPEAWALKGRVAVIGGGATALDCAVAAKAHDAVSVEMFALEKAGEMPLTSRERGEVLSHGIDVSGRTRVTAIRVAGGRIVGLDVMKVHLPDGVPFSPAAVRDVEGSQQVRHDIDHVIMAIGARPRVKRAAHKAVFCAGDMVDGPSTVVEASAAGKNAAARVMAYVEGRRKPRFDNALKSTLRIPGYHFEPVSLETDFFGRTLSSPFLLSASPASDGYEQMKRAYEEGWAGGIMKTAFDNLPIHIPAAYMTCFDESTWGNCDNVSEHPLDRVCREVRRLVKEYPDRLTGASTGGTVSSQDEADRASWQGNTRKLEAAGAMVIEYSLSCPQGGEGAEGDIVSQNAALTAKIVDWVMEAGRADIPKLFKLTSAVTDIKTILKAVKTVSDRYPHKKAGVTLANTFPSLTFKPGKHTWEDGVVVGMSGEGITPVSYLCLAAACGQGIDVSGNAGPVNYRAAANFLALGTNTVQFCTVVEKHGYGILRELRSGLSHLLAERGIRSVAELRGITQPNPIRDFMDLDADKQVSTCNRDLCVQCGNCTRCPYLAVTLDTERYPVTDPSKCLGCSLCALQCFVGALSLRDRTPAERWPWGKKKGE